MADTAVGGRDADRSTRSIHAADTGRALSPDLVTATTWRAESFADAARAATSMRPDRFYARFSNPSVRAFENAIAHLEGAEGALAFGSGMGAVATVILALCSSGSHVVATEQLYAGTLAFLQGPCRRFGIDTTLVDGTEPGAMAAAVQPGRTTLVIAETPSNPVVRLVDLDELGSIAGPFTMVDSTLATPLGQRPLDHGVDIVMHSATKTIAGHNDATIGVVAAEQELIDTFWAYSVLHGATPSPFDATNALRGIKTLGLRHERVGSTALTIARWLREQADVAAVHYPGLDEHPQHGLASTQMSSYGSMLSFDAGDETSAARLLDHLGLIGLATSFGGPESLACHPATTTAASLTLEEKETQGVTPGLVRLSVGLEDADDLIADLAHAMGR